MVSLFLIHYSNPVTPLALSVVDNYIFGALDFKALFSQTYWICRKVYVVPLNFERVLKRCAKTNSYHAISYLTCKWGVESSSSNFPLINSFESLRRITFLKEINIHLYIYLHFLLGSWSTSEYFSPRHVPHDLFIYNIFNWPTFWIPVFYNFSMCLHFSFQ